MIWGGMGGSSQWSFLGLHRVGVLGQCEMGVWLSVLKVFRWWWVGALAFGRDCRGPLGWCDVWVYPLIPATSSPPILGVV